MKNKLFISLFLLPFFAIAQETTSDSSWIINRAGIFYQVRAQVFTSGNESQTLTLLGDTATTTQKFRDNIKSAATTFASDAQIVSGYRNQITELIRFGRTLPGILGKSPLDSLRADQPNLLVTSGWTLRTTGASTGIRFRVTGLGAFQWKADTTATWRAASFLVGVIRLNGLNGYATDFFKNSVGRWVTISQQYTIRPPGDVSARFFVDTADEPAQPAQPVTELLAGGRVRIGELLYKYNSKTKKWAQL